MATITEFLHCKYGTNTQGEITKSLSRLQIDSLLSNIKKKTLHSKLFESLDDNNFDIQSSSTWLKKGNISPKSEAMFSFLQDRNIFFRDPNSKCSHCKSSNKTVDHMATRCNRMLNSDYTRRHNEISLDSSLVVKHKKPFTDGEILKSCFLEAADSLFDGMKNKQEISNCIKELQLSKQSIVRRAESISENLLSQLKKDLYACSCFSLQFDESNDAIDIAHLCVFSRLIFHDLTVKEELFAIIPMKERTTGENIYNSFKTFLLSFELLPLMKKLVSITTDGALAMIGNQNGFIAFCRKDEHFPKFLSYHCIIHQHALCGKMLNFNYVMETTVKIINSIRAKPLQRRLFRLFLEQVDAIYGDLPLHCDIRWLSKGLILSRFIELLSYIKEFSKENNKNWHFLENPDWLINLAFLTDITSKLNELSLELQGKNRYIIDMISSINAFIMKLSITQAESTTQQPCATPFKYLRVRLHSPEEPGQNKVTMPTFNDHMGCHIRIKTSAITHSKKV
ncbi:zinc finger BED domain-containing protein 5-like [Octopus sinensis]|uniref:Zinc finger BED domain-containing protein 5-like n=1 Tax=Octopus sinensis TaxID=2607531 RepID=A0A6P7TX50_9MOLL|nr:zinc finger BED domain-containing protein 5-like [Octopus sinensis]